MRYIVTHHLTLFIIAIVSTLAAGCNQTMYVARTLPHEYMPTHATRPTSVDLTKLTGPSASSDVLVQGDLVNVTITTGMEKEEPRTWPLRVSNEGFIDVPVVGPVRVNRLTFTQAEQLVRNESVRRGKYVSPTVAISIETRRSNVVTVMGAVNKPGRYDIPSVDSGVLTAIVAAEGLHEDAGTMIEVWHPQNHGIIQQEVGTAGENVRMTSYQDSNAPYTKNENGLHEQHSGTVHQIDLAAPKHDVDYHVDDGTVIKVLPREPAAIQVIGLVNKPDAYELPAGKDLRLLDALALAGGRTIQLADKIRIIRHVPDSDQLISIGASVRAAKRNSRDNLRLAAGDVISIEETPVTFTVETLRSFIRFGFSSAIPGV